MTKDVHYRDGSHLPKQGDYVRIRTSFLPSAGDYYYGRVIAPKLGGVVCEIYQPKWRPFFSYSEVEVISKEEYEQAILALELQR